MWRRAAWAALVGIIAFGLIGIEYSRARIFCVWNGNVAAIMGVMNFGCGEENVLICRISPDVEGGLPRSDGLNIDGGDRRASPLYWSISSDSHCMSREALCGLEKIEIRRDVWRINGERHPLFKFNSVCGSLIAPKWLDLPISIVTDFWREIQNSDIGLQLRSSQGGSGLHFIQLSLHNAQLTDGDNRLRDRNSGRDYGKNSDYPGSIGSYSGRPFLGALLLAFGAALMKIAFYFGDTPRPQRNDRWLTWGTGIVAALMICQGVVLALTGNWLF